MYFDLPFASYRTQACVQNVSGQLSSYDMPKNVDPSGKKGVSLKQLGGCMQQKLHKKLNNFESQILAKQFSN